MRLITVIAFLFLLSCGKTVVRQAIHKTSPACTVNSYEDHAVIICPDGSHHVFHTPKTEGGITVVNECNVRQTSNQDNNNKQDAVSRQDADTRSRQDSDQDTRQTNRQED